MTSWNASWTEYANPNITGFYQGIKYANDTTGGMFGAGILVATFVVLFMLFRKAGEAEALAASGIITLMLSGIMRMTGLVGDWVFALFTVLTAVGVLMAWVTRRQ